MALADLKKNVDDADLMRLAREAQSGRDAEGGAGAQSATVTSGTARGGKA
jgi:hypothetical protein